MLSFQLLPLIFLTTLLPKTAQTATPASLLHVPFNHTERFTPKTIFQRFPEYEQKLRPEILSWRLLSIPLGIRQAMRYMAVTVTNGQVTCQCYTTNPQCVWRQNFCPLIERYVRDRPQARNLYCMFILRDETHHRTIRQWLQANHYNQPEFSNVLASSMELIANTPTFQMSADLSNPLEKLKLVVPDGWMLFMGFQRRKNEAKSASEWYPWETKSSKIFWRGSDTGKTFEYVNDYFVDLPHYWPRVELIRYTRDYPDIVDAKFSQIDHGEHLRNRLRQLGLHITSSPVSIADHIKFKYLISVDGWTAAWFRPQWIMSSNSVFLKQQSQKVQWYYDRLIPYKHYIPIKNDLSDLLEIHKYCESHQEEMKNITKEANKFAAENFDLWQVEGAFFKTMDEYVEGQKWETVFSPILDYGRAFEDIITNFKDEDRRTIFRLNTYHKCDKKIPQPIISEHPLLKYRKLVMILLVLELLYGLARVLISYIIKVKQVLRELQRDRINQETGMSEQ